MFKNLKIRRFNARSLIDILYMNVIWKYILRCISVLENELLQVIKNDSVLNTTLSDIDDLLTGEWVCSEYGAYSILWRHMQFENVRVSQTS